MIKKKPNYLNFRLVGILRTKPATPAINAITAIQTAFDAGLEAVEITSNSDFWQEILDVCVKKNLNIGAGSIKNKEKACEAINHGAKFLVSPGFFEDTIEIANQYNIPILPGVFTESDLKKTIDFRVADIKFFPANVKTHEELFKAIKEPFRDEFEELNKKIWEILAFSNQLSAISTVVKSPTQFYKFYLKAKSKKPGGEVVIKLPDGRLGFERLKEFADELFSYQIRTYAVGGVNDKNMKEVLTRYGTYGVCLGSGIFNADAIFNGDFKRVRADVKRHVEVMRLQGFEVVKL
ncbi:MAG: hypothetical protein HYY52_07015 [Candidatus Melainabacteria bacterium]|nr:hypothetical protein [Candidatus Melainabacteria bacterium]